MNLADVLGPPVQDVDDLLGIPSPACIAPPPPPEPGGEARPRHRLRIIAVAAAMVLVGFAAGIYVGRTGEPRPAGPAAVSGAPAAVMGFSGFFVAIHLGGRTNPSVVSALYAGSALPLPPEQANTWVNRAAAVDARQVGDRVWEVTVAADVLERVDGVYQETGLEYFELTVEEGPAGPVALTAPARVPPPAITPLPHRFDVALGPDQAAAAESSLDAYLTGDTAFTVAPYQQIDVVSLTADGTGKVDAVVTAIAGSGHAHRLEYRFEMAQVEGEWRVIGLPLAAETAP